MNSAIWRMGSRHGVVYVDNRDVAQAILACAGSVKSAETEMAVYFRNGKRVGWQFRFTLEFWDQVSEMVGAPPRTITPASLVRKSQSNAGVAELKTPPILQPPVAPAKASAGLTSAPSSVRSRKPAKGKAVNTLESSAGNEKPLSAKPAHPGAKQAAEPVKPAAPTLKQTATSAKQASVPVKKGAAATKPAALPMKPTAVKAKPVKSAPVSPAAKPLKPAAASVKTVAAKPASAMSASAKPVTKTTNPAAAPVKPTPVAAPSQKRSVPVAPVQKETPAQEKRVASATGRSRKNP